MSHRFLPSDKYILHVDGDCFFASCEVAVNPQLRGKPVVTGQDRGIASSMTYEAKALGITRGMPIYKIKNLHPEITVVSSDYDLYNLFSRRMINIVKRYTDKIWEYSIDECFADITSIVEKKDDDPWKLGNEIKDQLQKELGLTFSLGIASTTVLAKVASKANKPNGLTVISNDKITSFLKDIPIQKVWGIGRQTSHLLNSRGIKTALEFTNCSFEYIRSLISKPYQEIYRELKGFTSSLSIIPDSGTPSEISKSISRTRTFYPPSGEVNIIYSELSKNAEEACSALRREKLVTGRLSFFLKDQGFRYYRTEISLIHRTSSPEQLLSAISYNFNKVYKKGLIYRSSGLTLMDLKSNDLYVRDIFGSNDQNIKREELHQTIDFLLQKQGANSIFLGSSMRALTNAHRKENRRSSFIDNLPFPYLGEVN